MALGPDPHSWANYEQVVTTRIDLVWDVCFATKQIRGTATLALRRLVPDLAVPVLLDCRGLEVARVYDARPGSAGGELAWSLAQHHPVLGSCLRIELPPPPADAAPGAAEAEAVVAVEYRTTAASAGLQWFEPHQTLGGERPFMYSQFQAILARTALPCQDTPAVKCPYGARVTVPAGLVAICSGELQPASEANGVPAGERATFHYEQAVPIPAYLIALAVGALARQPLGPRTHVWAEPALLERAAAEFAGAEAFLAAAEQVVGVPYRWGKAYGLLVLPHAFPYGGMENPNCTFVNQSLVVGDRSLEAVVAHEIIHSWTGNLVTNASWRDFWLNEGFTRYVERLVLGRVYGDAMRQFSVHVGYKILLTTVRDLADLPEHRKLQPDLPGEDPDDSFSRVPYEKGSLFLLYLEGLVGGPAALCAWLTDYLLAFERRSVSSAEMRRHFADRFPEAAARVDWDLWLRGADLPDFAPSGGGPMLEQVERLAAEWLERGGAGAAGGDLDWHPLQTLLFLDTLLLAGSERLGPAAVARMAAAYPALADTPNPEIGYRWLLLALRCGGDQQGVLPHADRFLSTHGRGLYVKPLYVELARLVRAGRLDLAALRAIYDKNAARYHQCLHSVLEAAVRSAVPPA